MGFFLSQGGICFRVKCLQCLQMLKIGFIRDRTQSLIGDSRLWLKKRLKIIHRVELNFCPLKLRKGLMYLEAIAKTFKSTLLTTLMRRMWINKMKVGKMMITLFLYLNNSQNIKIYLQLILINQKTNKASLSRDRFWVFNNNQLKRLRSKI